MSKNDEKDVLIPRTNIVGILERKIKMNSQYSQTDWGMYLYHTSDVGNLPTSIRVEDGRAEIMVVGTDLPEIEGVPIKFYGRWEDKGKYGYRFNAFTFEVMSPATVSGMIKLLSSKEFPGVGKTSATAVVNMFGKETLEIIQDNARWKELYAAVRHDTAGLMKHFFDRLRYMGPLVAFLEEYGFSHDMAVRIGKRFGENAEKMIKANPYMLLQAGVNFQTCDHIARDQGVKLDAWERVEAMINEMMVQLCRDGHMYVKLNDLYKETLKRLNSGFDPAPVDQNRFTEVFKGMQKKGMLVVRFGGDVYTKAADNAEYNSVQRLLFLLSNPIDPKKVEACPAILDAYCEAAGIKLHPTQAEAVIRSISNRVSIITGGPGTGKTTIISAILACYERLFGDDILLMAPTGKAARRMSEATKRDAQTIHSRLRLFGEDSKNDVEPITKGLIVVDESSMVDNALMEKLMEAIESPECHLIFCGDIDQLPSVGAGAVLGEMIKSGVVPTSRLTETFRQKGGGALIIENAKKVNTGKTDLEYDETFEFVHADGDKDAKEKILRIYKAEVDKWGIENVALLCPLRSSQNGRFSCVADEMNKDLQKIINPDSPEKASVSLFGGKRVYRVGDRVMQWQNTKESANGDVGEIIDIGQSGGEIIVSIKWESGVVSNLKRDEMTSIKMAYAMSIHKSQGSEYQSVIIPVVSDQSCQLFKRNLLYTGITRAKKKVILVGDVEGINSCIGKTDTDIRQTHLADRLIKNAKRN